MLLLDRFPVHSIPAKGIVLVLRPASPQEVRNALRARECQSVISSAEQAEQWTELLDTHVKHEPGDIEPFSLDPGTCHYLASSGDLFHMSARSL